MSAGDWNTRLTLLQRAQNPDDDQAWEDFTRYYHKFVMVILHQMGVNENDKNDLAQEVLLSLWKSLPKFDFDSSRAKFHFKIFFTFCDYFVKSSTHKNL